MELCSVELLSLVGVISAVVHIIFRGLIQTFPNQHQLFHNLVLLVNIILLVYFGWCLYKNNEKKIS